jgi:hypothetical protein
VTGTRSEVQTVWTRALLGIQPRWGRDFDDLSNEWRRLFAEVVGTFLLVLAAAGGPAVSASVTALSAASRMYLRQA